MTPRIDHRRVAPDVAQAVSAMERVLERSPIDPQLRELMKVRAPQIKECGDCLDMHAEAARAQGETEQRLYALSAWHESPFFTDRERAALAWTDALTDLTDRVPDTVYDVVRNHFSVPGPGVSPVRRRGRARLAGRGRRSRAARREATGGP